MKKLRMIVTSVIVLAIVGSALAFNAKKIAVFCYSTLGTSTCDKTFTGKAFSNSGTTFHYYQGWSGLASECTVTGNQKCATTVKLIDDAE
jgi:hypothetical protein